MRLFHPLGAQILIAQNWIAWMGSLHEFEYKRYVNLKRELGGQKVVEIFIEMESTQKM